jgi:hypothetical protein
MNSNNAQTIAPETPSTLDGRLVVMPEYYLPKGAAKQGVSQKTVLLIIIAIISVLIVAVFAFIFFRTSQTPEVSQAPVVTPPIQEQPSPQEDEMEEEPEEEVEEEPEEIEPEGVVLPSVGVAQQQIDVDTDQDGLTDGEEIIFATSPAVPDTDGDSFLDGSEVRNLYDPASPGALLEVSPQMKIARNENRGYQLLIPTSWTTQQLTPTGEQFIIRPNEGDEQFTIELYENPERLTALQWYQDQQSPASATNFNNFENEAGWSGIISRDSTLVIATFDSSGAGARAFVYVMHYDTSENALLRFPSVWAMMTESLSILEAGSSETVTPNTQPETPLLEDQQTTPAETNEPSETVETEPDADAGNSETSPPGA